MAGEWDSSKPNETTLTQNTAKIIEYAWQMKKDAKADLTVSTSVRRLKVLAKLCDITEPEQVKAVLATTSQWQNGYKDNLATTYDGFLEFLGKKWKKPIYKREKKQPYIPTEQELDTLINAAHSYKTSAYLQYLKETGARMGEALRTKWIDIDVNRKIVYVHAEKGSHDRLLYRSATNS